LSSLSTQYSWKTFTANVEGHTGHGSIVSIPSRGREAQGIKQLIQRLFADWLLPVFADAAALQHQVIDTYARLLPLGMLNIETFSG